MTRALISVLLLLSVNLMLYPAVVPDKPTAATVQTSQLRDEVVQFLGSEIATHLADIKSLNPPPDRVLGAGASGEYTWGTFMRSVAAYAELSGQRTLAGKDLAREVGQIGLLEYRLGGTRFSQMYAVLALRHFGQDLNSNPVWKGLNEEERAAWRKLVNVSAFYDPKTQQVINLPENYLGVAARIASISYQLGLLQDRALLNGVVERAARPFLNGGLYSDDNPPTGRFDRYSNEYARFVWDAAGVAGRKDIQDSLRATLNRQMRLWWDLLLPDGYGYAWGRSLGVVSYLDTLEIVGFLARNPEFRPAPLAQLASAYYQAWRWLRHDYNNQRHMLSVFDYGRGNYGYISPDREWQQTVGFFGKLAPAHESLIEALEREKVVEFDTAVVRPDVARFEFFRQGDRKAGVWLFRQGPLSFMLPLTTGTKPGVADYLAAPHGMPGFAAPVEQVYPSLVPFIQLQDGRVFAAADGADEIVPSSDGRYLRAVWRRWALIGGKPGELEKIPLTSEVSWRVEGNTLVRRESLTADADLRLKRWWVAVPTTASVSSQEISAGQRWDKFNVGKNVLAISARTDWPVNISLVTPGNGPLGRGARGAVPLHLLFESKDIALIKGKSADWTLFMRLEPEGSGPTALIEKGTRLQK